VVFFKRDGIQEKEVQVVNQIKTEIKETENNMVRRRNLSILDLDTIEYVIKNFPDMSIEIQNGLNNLSGILENTIDYIEDKSSEIIKKNRDFKLSKDHRDTSMAIYGFVEDLTEYVKWMQDQYQNNIANEESKLNKISQNPKQQIQETYLEEVSKEVNDGKIGKVELEIYKDFSLKEPKSFKLDNNIVQVENWDDLLVKTAEVLTKQYRKNKNSNKTIKEIKPIGKKSNQNSFRDTVIEMLIEYKINLDEFKVIIK
jgi:hypothetical protein